MTQVNGNDMDDLFRRASDKYPLRTDSSDWDRLAADLEEDPSLILPVGVEETEGRRRRWLWLLLLLPLAGVGYYVSQGRGHGAGESPVVATAKTETNGRQGAPDSSDVKGGGRQGMAGGGQVEPGEQSGATGGAGSEGKAATGSQAGTEGGGQAVTSNGSQTGTEGNGKTVAGSGGNGQAVAGSGGSGKTNNISGSGKAGNGGVGSDKKDNDGGVAEAKTVAGARGTGWKGRKKGAAEKAGETEIGGTAEKEGTGRTASDRVTPAQRNAGWMVDRARTKDDVNLLVEVKAPVIKKDSSKNTPTARKKTSKPSFYVGLLGAPDFSSVKLQAVKGVGTTFGLLLGYSFNDRWAVESGVYVDRKSYYTDGEYFNTKSVPLPSNYYLKNVSGTCYMWEIPVNVRYNFSQGGGKTKWFATAGLSTYFMTRENYDYRFTGWTGPTSWPGSSQWDLKKPSQYWFSIVNISGGFEQRLGGIGNLRIEPYLRIPLSGLGTGKLNIMSSGLNIGITRRIW